ncbi:cytochrome c3 family protein [soil metagenome]
MSRIFPPNSRVIAGQVVGLLGLVGALIVAGIWYYGTPKYFRVGYAPVQPIEFSHKIHVGQLGMDCTYCHSHVKESNVANLPQAQTCWNCHGADKGNIKSDSPQLAPLREAYKSGQPIEWQQVHKLPDFAYFNHAAHVNRGVSCLSCHGQIDEMPRVRHDQPLSMSWCLDCHRNAAPALRPNAQVTNLKWDPARDPTLTKLNMTAEQYQTYIKAHANIAPPVTCTGCHR